jgi:hypothetical protein
VQLVREQVTILFVSCMGKDEFKITLYDTTLFGLILCRMHEKSGSRVFKSKYQTIFCRQKARDGKMYLGLFLGHGGNKSGYLCKIV